MIFFTFRHDENINYIYFHSSPVNQVVGPTCFILKYCPTSLLLLLNLYLEIETMDPTCSKWSRQSKGLEINGQWWQLYQLKAKVKVKVKVRVKDPHILPYNKQFCSSSPRMCNPTWIGRRTSTVQQGLRAILVIPHVRWLGQKVMASRSDSWSKENHSGSLFASSSAGY